MTGVSPRSALHRFAPLPKNIAGGLLSANIEFTANGLEPQLAAMRFRCAARLSCEWPPVTSSEPVGRFRAYFEVRVRLAPG